MKNPKIIKGKEAKFVFHLPAIVNEHGDVYREDTHVIKEATHYDDGSIEDNLRVLYNVERPFWVTKPHFRNHQQKKESESIDRLNEYKCTESDLPRAIGSRLGSRYIGVSDMRIVRDSPYVYGTDVSCRTHIKHLYQKRYPNLSSTFKVATFDIETNIATDEITILSLSMNDKIYTVMTKDYLSGITLETDCYKIKQELTPKLTKLYKKHIPVYNKLTFDGDVVSTLSGVETLTGGRSGLEFSKLDIKFDKETNITVLNGIVLGTTPLYQDESIKGLDLLVKSCVPYGITKDIKITYDVAENELDAVRRLLSKAHMWKPDFIAIWNLDFDIPKIVEVLRKNNVDPKDYFSDPTLPENLRYFHYKEGAKQKMTDSGKHKPVNPEEQWHVVNAPASFYWIDAMSSHRYIRAGGKTVSGGYSLDNLLKMELGNKLGKLKFEDEKTNLLKGAEWHIYMSTYKKLEYVIYNQWDNISMLVLDNKTKDLKQVLPMLSGVSNFDIFNSGPKRIVDALHYFYLDNGYILATKPSRIDEKENLGLGEWIVLLPSSRIKENGAEIFDVKGINSNIRKFVYDSDQVSGYPSNTQAANVSRDSTVRELLSIRGMDINDFRLHNINLFFGKVNIVEYGSEMLGLPKIDEVFDYLKKEKHI